MRVHYGVTDEKLVEQLRLRTRKGDLDGYPRFRFVTDPQLHGRSARAIDRVVMTSNPYLHANEQATRMFCRAASNRFGPCAQPRWRRLRNRLRDRVIRV